MTITFSVLAFPLAYEITKMPQMTDIVQRLLDAHADMRTGTREELKEAADEILSLREKLREAQTQSDHWFVRASE